MTKAILLAWLATSQGSAPAEVAFDNVAACLMAASELQHSANAKPGFVGERIVARCVDMGMGE